MKNLSLIVLILVSISARSQNSENTNRSLPYFELLDQYRKLDDFSEKAKLIGYGKTDCGEPLQLFVISGTSTFNPERLHELGKCILFINNGIHPGEPDGMDASLLFAKNILSDPNNNALLENVVVCIIPAFNIDGALNRDSTSRVNQNGPEEYGFRGNSKNLDLNRDFIKTDASNTHSLKSILLQWSPDVFVDTHVSDGADYQYTMTLISSQYNKMNPVCGKYMHETFTPLLFKSMKEKGDDMTPYVSTLSEQSIPDSGIVAFLETPRFASGYMSLYNTFSFITETHMLKPFQSRKKSTYRFLNSILKICSENKNEILKVRSEAFKNDSAIKEYKYNWELNSNQFEPITFNGYTAEYPSSSVTGMKRLKYNHEKPYSKKINYYNTYEAKSSIKIPRYFYLPQAYENIARLLEGNGIICNRVQHDSLSKCQSIIIDDYKTTSAPYEGHYLHSNITTHSIDEFVNVAKGDYMISTNQPTIRILMEVLTPDAVDSYFAWGFFDSILQEKEWFLDYVFEDIAEKLLKENNDLKMKFEKWKLENPNKDSFNQLFFIYQNSPYFEKGFKKYPVRLIY